MEIEKLSPKSLHDVVGGFDVERFLSRCRIVTEDENGDTVEVTDIKDIKPDKYYWLDPQAKISGYWVTLGKGSDGDPSRYFRALKGDDSLSSEEIINLSEINSMLIKYNHG